MYKIISENKNKREELAVLKCLEDAKSYCYNTLPLLGKDAELFIVSESGTATKVFLDNKGRLILNTKETNLKK